MAEVATKPVDVDPTKAAVRAAVEAWNEKIKPGDPVLYWPGNRRSRRAKIDVVARAAEVYHDPPRALVVLRNNWRGVPIGHVRLHRLAGQIRALAPIEGVELDFPPPNCPYCVSVPCEFDDPWVCPECAARWPEAAHQGGAIRRCVECFDRDATAIGGDGQPRCAVCHVEVLAGVVEATEPYNCRSCKVEVVGMPVGREASNWSLCGHCNHRRKWDEWLSARVGKRTGSSTQSIASVRGI
ncbi:hypothetical protein I0C86_40455 [Plantactinospora sp. S1510]|uniref:Uncharacterized protein n=1 Tax=Plantactinospora alkalitolerans TaxID=2789879 RepID=A0ABS0H9J0_9ACTN|nr:hypothetical protein [Plantactinospora alkalitolerans]MBF9135153.1 hypothetical protein [Plantactinospora alkalitolerans]